MYASNTLALALIAMVAGQALGIGYDFDFYTEEDQAYEFIRDRYATINMEVHFKS